MRPRQLGVGKPVELTVAGVAILKKADQVLDGAVGGSDADGRRIAPCLAVRHNSISLIFASGK